MKKFSLSVLLCSLVISLVACGENFLASNVSLGGSGSGAQKPVPGSNDNSSNPPTGDGDETYEYVAKIPADIQSICSGVERHMRFVEAESKLPIPADTLRSLSISALQIEIHNTTPNYIYEMIPNCRPVDFKIGSMNIEASQSFKCVSEQNSIQVLKPFETRTYEIDLKFAITQEPITISYYAFYSTELPSSDTIWDKCDTTQTTVLMYKRRVPKTEDNDTSLPPIELPSEAEAPQ
ncbi:hypothetical protein [Acinetobacter modestus]|uniref:hypothetical protein n=1 Tax=Acinetobacter modestus TaxID=1776740 RepID=UPI003018D27F